MSDWREDLLATWSTERLKTLQVWHSFADADLEWRPPDPQRRGRSVREHFVHQCVSEDRWCSGMLGFEPVLPALPTQETRNAFIALYADHSARRLDLIGRQPVAWWHANTRFFDSERSRLWIVMRRLLHTAHHRGQLTAYLRYLGRRLWSTYGPTADTGGLNQDAAPTIYAYADEQALLADPAGDGAAPLPGPPAERAVSERPAP